MKINFHRKQSGFTLIELLVVIGILTILLAIVLIAINPARQFAQSRNTTRKSDVNAILNAIHAYMADDSNGAAPTGIDTTVKTITSTAGATNVDICGSLVPKYLAGMPKDPGGPGLTAGTYTSCASYSTQYTVTQATTANGGRVTVAAPNAELSEVITVSR